MKALTENEKNEQLAKTILKAIGKIPSDKGKIEYLAGFLESVKAK
jgi:hypothetical protein